MAMTYDKRFGSILDQCWVNFRHLMKNISKKAHTVKKILFFEKYIAKNYYNCLQHERVVKIFLL